MNSDEATILNSLDSNEAPVYFPSTQPIAQAVLGFRSAHVLFTAVSLNLFEQFKKKPKSASDVANSLSLDERACEIFLDALTALGFLTKDSCKYSNSLIANDFLLPDSPRSLYHNLRFQFDSMKRWSDLSARLQSRSPGQNLPSLLNNPDFTKNYILGMREISRLASPSLVRALSKINLERFLDIGAGPGAYTLALLESYPRATAVLLDLPETLEITRILVQAEIKRIEFFPGDYHLTDFGDREFDLILLSHVTHDESVTENNSLLNRTYKALRPGGHIAIHDFMLDESRTHPLFGALFSVHMLTYTQEGRTYTRAEYKKWLQESCFIGVEEHRISEGTPMESVLMVAEKPS